MSKNVGRNCTLDTDRLAMALLQYRNTPDRDLRLSPVHILFARKLNNVVPVKPGDYTPKKEWLLTARARELALAK